VPRQRARLNVLLGRVLLTEPDVYHAIIKVLVLQLLILYDKLIECTITDLQLLYLHSEIVYKFLILQTFLIQMFLVHLYVRWNAFR
jgi:hypothetical protein